MCFGGGPDIPPMPEQKDPILPAQPIQPQQPAALSVGRKDEEQGDTKRKISKARRKLRIQKDNVGIQTVGSSSGSGLSASGTKGA